MCNFENILRFSHFSIVLEMSKIKHILAKIMNPKNSASGNFFTFSMSAIDLTDLTDLNGWSDKLTD